VFEFGSIVLARFPFTDPSGDKRRPVLVMSRDNDRRADVVACFITSIPRSRSDMAPIDASAETGLKVISVFRFDKVATLRRIGWRPTVPRFMACSASGRHSKSRACVDGPLGARG
jgi:mRNA interferase MazF